MVLSVRYVRTFLASQRRVISSKSSKVKLIDARARIFSCSTPKYTESDPLSKAACSDSKFPAGAINSIFCKIFFFSWRKDKIL